MRHLLLVLLSYFPILTFAQITFEKGYFIKNNDEKVECLIYDEGWKNNPTEIDFKTSTDGEVQTITIEDMKEFGFVNSLKFIRFTGNIDVSGNKASRYSEQKEPEFENQTIFLKVLVEGTATLYAYSGKQLERYYYKMQDGQIEPLIYKIYLLDREGVEVSAINTKFRRQLLISMQCETMTMQDVDKLEYNSAALEKYFLKYYNCLGEEATILNKKKRYNLNLGIKAGVAAQTFSYESAFVFDWETTQISPRLGIEAEFIMPFNKNKWAILLEPTYQMMNSEETVVFEVFPNTITRKFVLTYQSIELQAGVRYYAFLNKNSKLFVNALLIRDFDLNSTLELLSPTSTGSDQAIELNSYGNMAIGLGYKYKDLGSVEFRYYTNRSLTYAIAGRETAYRNISLSFCYDLF